MISGACESTWFFVFNWLFIFGWGAEFSVPLCCLPSGSRGVLADGAVARIQAMAHYVKR